MFWSKTLAPFGRSEKPAQPRVFLMISSGVVWCGVGQNVGSFVLSHVARSSCLGLDSRKHCRQQLISYLYTRPGMLGPGWHGPALVWCWCSLRAEPECHQGGLFLGASCNAGEPSSSRAGPRRRLAVVHFRREIRSAIFFSPWKGTTRVYLGWFSFSWAPFFRRRHARHLEKPPAPGQALW